MAGLPPFGGFIGKAMLLQATLPASGAGAGSAGWIWAAVFAGSLFGLLALSRAGSTLFWKSEADSAATEAGSVATHGAFPATHAGSRGAPLQARDWAPVVAVLGLVAAVSVGAAPLQRYVRDAADDLLQPAALIDATLRARPMPGPHTPAPETRR
jgi:multicomponent K+:H+ antiporter subunit D